MVCIINSVNPGPETHKGGPWVPVVPKLDVIMLIISLLIVNRIGNNRNHREGTCETLRCTVFFVGLSGWISMVYVWNSGQTRVSAR